MTLPVNCDLSQTAIEEALELLGNHDPDWFTIKVHPYAKHLANSIAFDEHHFEDMRHKYQVVMDLNYDEYEWSVHLNGNCVWCQGV
jgi:hypothetical protein